MASDDTPADPNRYRRLDSAFRRGDLGALRGELGALEGFPNVEAHPAMGLCLTYAIYHSPLALVRALLEAGADPNGVGVPRSVTCARGSRTHSEG
jgi:uncharacterized protein